jgi:hypothetical protein
MSLNSSSPTGSTFSSGRSASPTSSVVGSVYDSDAVEAAAVSVLGSLSTSWSSEFPSYLTHPDRNDLAPSVDFRRAAALRFFDSTAWRSLYP